MSGMRVGALAMQLGDLVDDLHGLDGSIRGLVALERDGDRWDGFRHGVRVSWTLAETIHSLKACVSRLARELDRPAWAQEVLALEIALPRLLLSDAVTQDPECWNAGMGVWFDQVHALLDTIVTEMRTMALEQFVEADGLSDRDLDALRGS